MPPELVEAIENLDDASIDLGYWEDNLAGRFGMPQINFDNAIITQARSSKVTCPTLMDDADIPLKIKQLILGHGSTDITSKVYIHKTQAQLLDAINRI